jgi:nitrogen fixation protein FixH
MSDMGDRQGWQLTGRHVLIGFVSFFAVVIGVNLFMAFKAVGTFPGLETKNSFVESQTFDARRDAQAALGWDVAAVLEDGVLAVAFTDQGSGAPVEVVAIDAVVGRPTSVAEDRRPDFTYRQGVFRTPMTLPEGNWDVRLVAWAPDGTEFRRRVEVDVR